MSYNQKHNEANGEDNNDGSDNNDSWNMGVEGPTDDPQINALRERQMRNFLTTLLLSQGVPMLTGGDEVARSQKGNNNCYCQDNELTWMDWNLDDSRKRLREFTCQASLNSASPIPTCIGESSFRIAKFAGARMAPCARGEGCVWFNPDGNEVSDEAWNADWTRAIALLLNGCTLQVSDEDGKWIIDDSFLLLSMLPMRASSSNCRRLRG